MDCEQVLHGVVEDGGETAGLSDVKMDSCLDSAGLHEAIVLVQRPPEKDSPGSCHLGLVKTGLSSAVVVDHAVVRKIHES